MAADGKNSYLPIEYVIHYAAMKLCSSDFNGMKKQSLCLKQFNNYILLTRNCSH